MIENPDKYLQTFIAYGVDEVVVHFRSLFGGELSDEGAREARAPRELSKDIRKM
jgi:hypothetical protein